MRRIFTLLIMTWCFAAESKAATTYNITSNTSWSSAFPSYCGSCVINISPGVTLNLNTNGGMCDKCTITGGTLKITSGFSFQSTTISNSTITSTSSFALNSSNSFNNVTAVISGSSSFTSNGTLTITNSTFTFQNTSSFTSNAQLNLDNSHLYFDDNTYFLSNSSTVNLNNSSTITAGDGSKSSKAYFIFYGQLNLVDASSMLIVANVNNYYLSWNTYTSSSNHKTYTTTNNNQNCGGAGQNACSQGKYYGGAVLSSTGVLPITVLPVTFSNFKGVQTAHDIRLSWSLSDISGNVTLELEHSTDAIRFSPIATMQANGSETDYAYTDASPADGENDYRIKSTDANGVVAYSKIISFTVKPAAVIRLFPNPCINGDFNVRFPSVQSAMIRIFTAEGRLVYMASLSGQSQYAIHIPGNTGTGWLVVQLIYDGEMNTYSLMTAAH
ncbi:MAG TPA: hypothetical protein VG890_04660 [Puia sp.]|nr:hypothetical protein [Puia sp.]